MTYVTHYLNFKYFLRGKCSNVKHDYCKKKKQKHLSSAWQG